MNEAEMFLKLAVLFLILTIAIFLPLKIHFSRNYLFTYVASVAFFVYFYCSVFFGFKIDGAWNSLRNALVGAPGFNSSVEGFERRRAQLIEQMTRLGLSKEGILKNIEPINRQMIEGYASRVYKIIKNEIRFMKSHDAGSEKQNDGITNDWGNNFNFDLKSLMNLEGIDHVIRSLKVNDVYTEKIEMELNKLKQYILNSRIMEFDGSSTER